MEKGNCIFLERLCLQTYQFLQSDLSLCKSGRYEFSRGIYVNIDEYDTYERELRQYEAHRKYSDYQFIISGSEVIELKEYQQDRCTQKYDIQKDYEFYSNDLQGEYITLKAGEGLLIEPGKLHMPCLQTQNGRLNHVKKAVVKIPVSLFHDIKILVMDVDGTLTDGKIYMGNHGEVLKAFNIKDGYGINAILRNKNVCPAIITGRKSDIVANRCSELHIEDCYQGISNKLECLYQLINKKNLSMSQVAYIGDDDNDLECMKAIKEAGGMVACPRNSSENVLALSDYISLHDGGDGAVRDFIEYLIL